jgi:L-amino acid N-acyltransferase YncA
MINLGRMEIKLLEAHHWKEVKRIYEEGIATRNATFESSAPSWELWNEAHLKQCRFVVIDDGIVKGWAALTPVSDRCVYAGVAEISVYVSEAHRGMKIGKILLQKLIESSEEQGLWTLQAGIFPENKASVALHESNGFHLIGTRNKIGKMDHIWRDTLLLERRSKTVGV